MPYPPMMVQPMREELTRLGFRELTTPEEVDRAVAESSEPMLLVVNSVCGCAAGVARPGVALSLKNSAAPKKLATVFAGQDVEATARARSYFDGLPPPRPRSRSCPRAGSSSCCSATRSKGARPSRSPRRCPRLTRKLATPAA